MNILVLGGGGREHALAWAFAPTPMRPALVRAGQCRHRRGRRPASRSTSSTATRCWPSPARTTSTSWWSGPRRRWSRAWPTSCAAAGIAAFGPGRAAARLEGSKAFTKEICAAAARRPPPARPSPTPRRPRAYVAAQGAPIVVKADGLAAGKGVMVADDRRRGARRRSTRSSPRARGARVVIEEFLVGEEASLFVALPTARTLLPLGAAQDHKRVCDGDDGPEHRRHGRLFAGAGDDAGGDRARRSAEIIRPTLAEMAAAGTPFHGRALRRADDRATAGRGWSSTTSASAIPRPGAGACGSAAQLLDACLACAEGRLAEARVNFAEDHALTVVMAARGYPGDYARGEPIGLPERRRPAGAGLPRRHRARRRRGCVADRRAGAGRHRPRRDASPRRATAPTPRSTASTGPAASAAATSAGGRSRPGRISGAVSSR